MSQFKTLIGLLVICGMFMLTACGDSDNKSNSDINTDSSSEDNTETDPGNPPNSDNSSYTIGGTISGAQGSITLSLNNSNEVFSGTDFIFSATISANESYNVAFVASSQNQSCDINNGSGTATSDVSSISVSCYEQSLTTDQPYIAFTDLISGPANGLNDGLGNGVIVTVWGQNLGSDIANGEVRFTDSNGQIYQAYVYYWKNADGVLPSGPANLYRSHRMQEIAFSIPNAAEGPGTISVTVGGVSTNTLPFTIRPGAIYHVKDNGSDTSGDGSWDSPWLSAGHALDNTPAGSTLYLHDVSSGSASSERGIFLNTASASSTQDAQLAILSYPGFHPSVMGQKGFESYHVDAVVVSKLDFYSSDYTAVDTNDQPIGSKIQDSSTFAIKSSKHGRAVANRITDIPGGCASGMQGAITGSAKWGNDLVSNYKIYGNEIYEYGCAGSRKLHHTTYMSIRSDGLDLQVEPWEFGWNYLHDNQAKFGIHQFDQNSDCGDPTGPLKIHHNVVVNQGGAGISIGSECWEVDAYIEDNILINVGLAAAWDGINPSSSDGAENGGISIRDSGLVGTMYISNNLVYGHTSDGQTNGAQGCLNLYGGGDSVAIEWNNNICYSDYDLPFIGTGYNAEAKLDNVSGGNNVWYFSGLSPVNAIVPSWDAGAITVDPLLGVNDAIVNLFEVSPVDGSILSPLMDAATSTSFDRDIYGNPRDTTPDIGPVEY
jgi:hypothetical protein